MPDEGETESQSALAIADHETPASSAMDTVPDPPSQPTVADDGESVAV